MAETPTSFILRFRDLVTPEGQTIERHKVIADEHGHVWWGWWCKSGERPAVHTLAALHKAHPTGLPIFLADSGRNKLFRATCLKTQSSLDAPMPTPDSTKTPAYYNDQKYLAWHQLTEFEEITDAAVADELLRAQTYVCVNEFFETEPSPFTPFYGKRIYNVRELVQQNRTVWFTRAALATDPAHEIALLNADHTRPHHFAPTYFGSVERRAKHVLWVSDLHFSNDGQKHHAFPDSSDAQQRELWLALENALSKISTPVSALAGIIVSGDITWRADPDEFKKAVYFLERVCGKFGLDPRQIAICPGNHDVAFSSDPAAKGVPVAQAGATSRAAYSKFHSDLFYQTPNEFMSSGRRWLLGGALPVDVVTLNTSLLQQHPDKLGHEDLTLSSPFFQGQGFIGQQQLDDVVTNFGWDEGTLSPLRAYRVVVMHHHVLPVTYSESATIGANYSVVLDAERLMRWLVRYRVDVVLHGHQHQPFTATIARRQQMLDESEPHTFTVIGMGSTGVAAAHLGETKENTFGVLEFAANELLTTFHTLHPVNPSSERFRVSVPYRTGLGRGT